MKTVRLNKVVKKEVPVKLNETLQAGNKVKLRAIPKDIKKAKRFFEVDKIYKIKEPPKNHINGLMCVHLKGRDGKIYPVSFPYFIRCAN